MKKKFGRNPVNEYMTNRDFFNEGFWLVLDGIIQMITFGRFHGYFFLDGAGKRLRRASDKRKAMKK